MNPSPLEVLAGVAVPALIVGLAALAMPAPALPEGSFERAIMERMASGEPAPTVLIGNSVGMASVESDYPDARLMLQGSHPAHWVALIEHAGQMSASRAILYSNPQRLVDRRLDTSEQLATVLDLDPSAELLVATESDPGQGRLQQRRVHLRDELVTTLSRAPTDWLFGHAVDEPPAASALDRLFPTDAGPNPTQPRGPIAEPAWKERYDDGSGGLRTYPTRAELDDSLLPLLIERAIEQDIRLVVVLPAASSPYSCDEDDLLAPLRGWLQGQPVDVIDLSTLDLGRGEFTGRYHAQGNGRTRITAELASRLDELGPTAPDAPTRWSGGCAP